MTIEKPKTVSEVRECEGCPMRRLFPSNSFVAPTITAGKRLVVGEAPGSEENAVGHPLVGGSGRLFDSFCSKAGIKRADLSIVNTIQCQPPGNVYPTDPDAKSYIPRKDAEIAVQHCYRAHVEPLLKSRKWERIDLLGAKALERLTGLEGIGRWRGSPLAVPVLGPEPRAIATIHPAAVMRNQEMLPIVINDLAKSLRVPPEFYNLRPSLEDVQRFTSKKFALDIETQGFSSIITMVGLCDRSTTATVVPFRGPYIAELKRILLGADRIITQNGIAFDIPLLEKNLSIDLKSKYHADIMLGHHLLFPDFPHGLDFIGSQFTNRPAWKHDQKDYLLYNARDVDTTYMAYEQIWPMLKQEQLLRLYELVQIPLARICKHMSDTGFRIDKSKIADVRRQLEIDMAGLETQLPESLRTQQVPIRKRELAPPGTRSEKTGKPLKYVMVDATETVMLWRSPAAKQKYMYEELGLTKQTHAKSGKVTTDKTALEKLWRKTHNPALKAIQELMKLDELKTTFCKEGMLAIDEIHSSFHPHGTNSGRLSSSDVNLQNQPESTRCIYVPHHHGWSVCNFDFSGIENRLTAFLANDTKRLANFLTIPDYSEHKVLASRLSGIPYSEIKKSSDPTSIYSKSKHIVHGPWRPTAEVLTPQGWVAMKDWTEGTPIAEYEPNDKSIVFRVPKETVWGEAEKLLEYDSNYFATSTTPEHGFLATQRWTGDTRRFQAKELNSNYRIPVGGDFVFGDWDFVDVRLAAAIQADGSLNGRHAVFHLVKQRKQQRLEEVLAGKKFVKAPCGCHVGGVRYHVPASVVDNALWILENKQFNAHILNLTKEAAEILFEEVFYWDGCFRKNHKLYFNKNGQSAGWVHTLAHLLGRRAKYSVTPHFRGGSFYHVYTSLGKKPIATVPMERREVEHNGPVVCFTTQAGYFLVKYNNVICVSGNTNYGLGARKCANMYDMDYKETKSMIELWKSEIADTTKWQEETAERAKREGVLTTPFGRKRWFWGTSVYTESLSFLPQSTAADIIFRAMIGLMYERIGWPLEKVLEVVRVARPLPRPAELLISVHDSLVFECPNGMVPELVDTVTLVMQQPWRELGGFSIPVAVEVGDSWGTAVTYRPSAPTNIEEAQ